MFVNVPPDISAATATVLTPIILQIMSLATSGVYGTNIQTEILDFFFTSLL